MTDQPIFAVAGFWQSINGDSGDFAMVTCDPNELVAPIHPKAMITVLEEADWDRWLTDPMTMRSRCNVPTRRTA